MHGSLLSRRGEAGRLEPRMAWIFGSPRSGSTWLLQLLSEHEAVIPVNEPLIGFYLSPFLSDTPGFSGTNLGSEDFTVRQVRAGAPSHFFATEFEGVWRPWLGRFIRERLLAHAVRYPAPVPLSQTIVAIKEPSGSQSADVLMRALPRSRLLFLLRDGRDVVDSELDALSEGGWVGHNFPGATGIREDERLGFVTQSAQKWLWRTEVVQRAYRDHSGPKLLVRYEDLRAQTVEELLRTCDWLGLRVTDAWLERTTHAHAFEAMPAEQRGSGAFFRSANPGSWREGLTPEEQDAVHAVIGPKLAELGYDG